MRKTATRDGKGGRGRLWGVGVKEGINNGFSVPSDSNLFTIIQIPIFFYLRFVFMFVIITACSRLLL